MSTDWIAFAGTNGLPGKKLTRPGGRPGGSGVRHGVDEAPVPDADPQFLRPISVVIAGADAADEIAVGVELANPADLGSCEWLGMSGNNREEMPGKQGFPIALFCEWQGLKGKGWELKCR
jgi:hypothetical protein